MRILVLISSLIFCTQTTLAELSTGGSATTETPSETVVSDPSRTTIDTNEEEAAWREENNCPPPPADASPAALSCAKGVIASLGSILTTPYSLFKADQQCYNDKEYKKGLMSVVAPLLTGDGRSTHDFSNWPEGSTELLQNSPMYQSYMNLSCSEVMRMVTNRERRTLSLLHNKELKQKEYERYISRAPNDSRRLAQAERRYPVADRTPTPEELTFKRLYDTRKAMLEPGSNERFLQRAGNKALCLWKNTTVRSICEMGTDVAVALGTMGVGLAGAGAKTAVRAAAREASEQAGESIRDTTLRRNGALTDPQREAAAQSRLGRGLTSSERDAVIEAHNVGADRPGSGIGNYTQAEISEKARILREAGFSASERRALMEDGIAGRNAPSVADTDALVRGEIGVASRNSDITREMGLADVARGMDRDEGLSFRDSGRRTGAYWQRDPEQRSGVASNVRRHLDEGGVMSNRQQRDEMLRITALDTVESTRGGRVPDYERLAKYYERAGRPIDDSFVSYLTQGIPANSSHSRFILESQIAESNMAIHRLTQQARYYADGNRARGLDMTPDQGRSRAREIQEQIKEIERQRDLRRGLLERGSIRTDVH